MAETLQDGINSYKKGRFSDALAIFLSLPTPDIHSQEKGSLDIPYYIGLCYARLKRYDEALLYLEQVVTTEFSEKRIRQCRLTLAVIYSLTGRSSFADFELKKLLEDGYETAEVYSALAFLEWEQEQVANAIEYYEKAIKINPLSPTALNGLGYVLASEGRDLTRALTLCKKAHEINPQSAAFLDSLAWVYYKLGLYAEAQTFVTRARKTLKDNADIEEHYKIITADFVINKEQDRIAGRG